MYGESPRDHVNVRERSKSRFCIGPGKKPFTEILSRDGAYHEKQKNKPANHACSSAKSP